MTFRPAAMLVLTAILLARTAAIRADVANDQCATAQVLTGQSIAFVGNNTAANPVDDGVASCAFSSHNDVWFEYVASCNGQATIDTNGNAQFDTVLSVYLACGGIELACNDDVDGDFHAQLAIPVAANHHYWIRLASSSDPGNYHLNITCSSPPQNDSCETATVVSAGSPAAIGTNALASPFNDAEASCATSSQDVWFKYTADCDGVVSVDTLGSEIADPVLSIYGACGGIELACNDDDPAGGSLQSVVLFNSSAGATYWIRLASLEGAGNYRLNIACLGIPNNQTCATALPVSNGSPAAEGDNTLSNLIDGVSVSCESASYHAVWFSYTASCSGPVSVTTTGSAQSDTMLTVYDSCLGPELACNGDHEGDLHAGVTFQASACHSYLIRLASESEPGGYVLNVSCEGSQVADLNCDGVVDGMDIQPLILAIMSAPGFGAYQTQYASCDPLLADMNCSGTVDVEDVTPFVARLLHL